MEKKCNRFLRKSPFSRWRLRSSPLLAAKVIRLRRRRTNRECRRRTPPGQTAPKEAEAPDIGEEVASLFGSIEDIEKYDGENAVSAVGSLVIESGSFVIPYCYEGLEATSVTIRSGSIDIISSDDGINAADDDDDSRDPFKASTDNFVIIDSGSLTIVSEGDCIDSNGDIIVNGGTLRLTCGGNGNTAIDASGSFTNNGGDVTTNDGSESGNMGGGMGGGKPGGPGGGKPGGPGRP